MYLKFSEFKEFRCNPSQVYNITLYMHSTDAIFFPFSLRTKKDMHIMICGPNAATDLCYWISIGWNNTNSIIKKCPRGMLLIEGEFFEKCTVEHYINVSYHMFCKIH